MALSPGSRLPTPGGPEPRPSGAPNASLNGSWAGAAEPGPPDDPAALAVGAVLAALGVVGVAGNAYALLVTCRRPRAAAPLAAYVVSLALADLLYLLGIPFVVATYVTRRWHFGDLGCRVLVSLDFLSMHAGVFTLTALSRERCAAVLGPLRAARRPKGYRTLLALGAWLLALLLALPVTLAVRLGRRGRRSLCLPAWGPRAQRAYLTLLFGTSVVGPGLVIGLLYARLARAYWRSQRASFPQTRRLPNPRVLRLIAAIVLLFWACFLPFWLWQLLAQYRGAPPLSPRAARLVNYLTTCLTYGNSCVDPFFYTLLSRSYRDARRRPPRARPARGPGYPLRGPGRPPSPGGSRASCGPPVTAGVQAGEWPEPLGGARTAGCPPDPPRTPPPLRPSRPPESSPLSLPHGSVQHHGPSPLPLCCQKAPHPHPDHLGECAGGRGPEPASEVHSRAPPPTAVDQSAHHGACREPQRPTPLQVGGAGPGAPAPSLSLSVSALEQ